MDNLLYGLIIVLLSIMLVSIIVLIVVKIKIEKYTMNNASTAKKADQIETAKEEKAKE